MTQDPVSVPIEKAEPKIYYGWFVVAACFFVTMSLGETMWSFGVFFKPLEEEFGWSRRLVSSGYTAFLLGYSLSAVVAGRLADTYTPRSILIGCGFLAGLGISLCSQTQTLNQFRSFLFLAGLGAGSTWTVPITTVQRWFYGRKRAGLALSIVVAGVGIGAMVFAPLINYLILRYGWRATYLIIGILFLLLIVLSSLLIRPSPPDLQPPLTEDKGIPLQESVAPPTLLGLATHSSFLIMTLATCIAIFVFQILAVHFVPYATDLGHTSTVAAAAVGVMGALSILGRLLGGTLSDRLGWKTVFTGSHFALALTMAWLVFLKAEWMLYGFAVLYGLFWGIRTTALAGMLGNFFGMRSLGSLMGIISAAAQTSGAFVPYLAGYVFDTIGSYTLVFAALFLLMFCVSLLATALKKPAKSVFQQPDRR
jgi:MFS transporter, OFA family, oxalate/formate antiporter